MKIIRNMAAIALTIAGTTFASGFASAATLGLTLASPSLEAAGTVVDFLAFGTDGDLSAFTTVTSVAGFGTFAQGAELSFSLAYDLSDPTGTATGFVEVFDFDTGADLVASEIVGVGFTTDMIEIAFRATSGSEAFDSLDDLLFARIAIVFDTPQANPFAALVDGESYNATITLSAVATEAMTPVPLPAGLPLLLAGLGVLGLVRRRSQS